MTKLSGTLPGGDNNGLGSLARALTADPHKTALIVAVVDCKSITIDTDTGDKVATVRIRRVELIDPQDTDQAQRLLVRGLERRTGAVMLPMDMEDELTALFANLIDSVDLETGEILDDEDRPTEELPEDESTPEPVAELDGTESVPTADEDVYPESPAFGQLTDEVTPPVTLEPLDSLTFQEPAAETPVKPKRQRRKPAATKPVAELPDAEKEPAPAEDQGETVTTDDDETPPWLR